MCEGNDSEVLNGGMGICLGHRLGLAFFFFFNLKRHYDTLPLLPMPSKRVPVSLLDGSRT